MRPSSGMVTSQVVNQEDISQPRMAAPTPATASGPRVAPPAGGDVVIADGGYVMDGGYVDGGYVDGGIIEGDYFDGGCRGGGDCGGCGSDACWDGQCGGCGPLYDPRDCCVPKDCWLGGLGGLFCNSEFYAGVQGFKHQVFQDPEGQLLLPENCSFGYHIGFNTGLPLYPITCGLVSGQFGVNYMSSNLNESDFSPGQRDQTFITTGLFRRVDYGLQFGSVADVLTNDWGSDLEIIQIRSELSWVWANGSNAGLRFNRATQDAVLPIGGAFVPRLSSEALNTYTLFYRKACMTGGYLEWYIGRTDEKHTIFGGDYDLPIGQKSALYASFNYVSPDDQLRFTDNEAWNLQMGISFRPRGRDWYKFYHRPLFKVVDNGTMIQSQRRFIP